MVKPPNYLRLLFLFFVYGCLDSPPINTQPDANDAAVVPSTDTAHVFMMPAPHVMADSLLNRAITLKEEAIYDSAIVYAEQAESLFQTLGDPTGIVRSGNTKGSALWKSGKFVEAEVQLNTVLQTGLSTLGEQNEHVALTYNELGIVHFNQNKFESCLILLNKATQIRVDLFGETHDDVAESYNNLGAYYYTQGLYRNTALYFSKALEIKRNLSGDLDPSLGAIYQNLGVIYRILGNYEESERMLKQSLEIDLASLGEYHPDVSFGLENLAILYHTLALYDREEDLYKQVLKIRQATLDSNHADIARSYHNIGAAYNVQEKHRNALEYLQKALRIRLKTFGPDHEAVASTLQSLGVAYRGIGRFDYATQMITKSIQIRRNLFGDKHPEIATSLLNLGKAYQLSGSPELARESFEEALSIQQINWGNNHPSLAASYYNLGTLHSSINNYESARVYLNKALIIQRKSLGEKHPDIARSYLSLGELAVYKSQFQTALSYFDRAIEANLPDFSINHFPDSLALDDALSAELMISTLNAKARTLYRRYRNQNNVQDLLAAHQLYTLSIDLMEKHRRSFRSEDSKLMINEKSVDNYSDALSVSLTLYRATGETHYQHSAFSIAEKSKASALLDALSEAEARRFARIPDSLLVYEKELRARLSFYDRNLKEEELKRERADSLKMTLWRDKLFTLRQNYDTLLDSLEHNYRDYYDLKYRNLTVSVDDVRARLLSNNHAIIEYSTGHDSLFIFALTNEDIKTVSLKRDSTLDYLIQQFRNGIITRKQSDYTSSAQVLYEMLLQPVSNIIEPKEHWIVVPDGVLNYIPFESLLTDSAEGIVDYIDYPFVLKNHSVQYAYSSSLRVTQQLNKSEEENSDLPRKDLIAFAPVFSEGIRANSRGGEVLNGAFTGSPVDGLDAWNFLYGLDSLTLPTNSPNLSSDTSSTQAWGYLPQTRTEVESIASLFRQHYSLWDRWFSDRSIVYIEKDARESVIKSKDLYNHRFIHFATHGLINESVPELSGIVLAQDADDGEDGVLHLGEVYNLNLDAELVVLSACETGLGKLARGEGLIGLSRGFMYAGAQSLLASLWRVEDSSTRDLMQFFYEDLLSGKPKTQAIRNAKLALIDQHPVFAFPYYWSGFILIGGE